MGVFCRGENLVAQVIRVSCGLESEDPVLPTAHVHRQLRAEHLSKITLFFLFLLRARHNNMSPVKCTQEKEEEKYNLRTGLVND